MSKVPHRNLGYEAKVALRVARMHPNAPSEEQLRTNLKLRFATFFAVRKDMKVLEEHEGESDCAICGKHHIRNIHDVAIGSTKQVVTIGDDCIDNISFVVGDGFFADRKEVAYSREVEKALKKGTLSKEAARRYRIRVGKGWKATERLPRGLNMRGVHVLMSPVRG